MVFGPRFSLVQIPISGLLKTGGVDLTMDLRMVLRMGLAGWLQPELVVLYPRQSILLILLFLLMCTTQRAHLIISFAFFLGIFLIFGHDILARKPLQY